MQLGLYLQLENPSQVSYVLDAFQHQTEFGARIRDALRLVSEDPHNFNCVRTKVRITTDKWVSC